MRLSLKKSCFFAKDLNFLNYTITNGAWSLSENQKMTINSLNTDNLTQTKRESLAAFINHFNRFHTGVSFAARVIRDKSTSPETVKSILDNIKKKLIESSALKSVNFVDDLHIYTDASQHDVSGIVLQKSKNGGFHLVTCFSRKLPDAMLNKSMPEKELWALQQITKTYRFLFIGRHKKVFYNDNKAVLSAKHSKAPSLRCLFDTISATFSNVKFEYTPTKKNASDVFTRQFNSISEQVNGVADRPRRSTANYKPIESVKAKIMRLHQNTGCMEAKRVLSTFQELGEPELKLADVTDILKHCETCKNINNHKSPRKSAPGITTPKETTCGCTIFMDHKVILSKTRRDFITDKHAGDPNWVADDKQLSVLTIFEPLSNHIQYFPVTDYSAETVKDHLRSYFIMNGPSRNVVSDNAPCFTTLKTWLKDTFDADLHHTSGYHPNSNLSERPHREFERIMKTYDTGTKEFKFENWKDNLAKACVAMNSMKHSKYNISAYEVHRNRVQVGVEPTIFHPSGFERRVRNEKFMNKAGKLYKSNLKVVLPTFTKNQKIKVKIPDQEIRIGTVTSTKDNISKKAVQVKFGKERPIAISKDFICLPRFGDSDEDSSWPVFSQEFSTENDDNEPVAENAVADAEHAQEK